jgi:cystinosin
MNAYETLSFICGVVYFVSWSVSFYPQVHLNWRRRSVRGLSFDFQLLNVTGYTAYSLFNCLLKLVPVLSNQYVSKYGPPIPVDWSDLGFAVHGLLITIVTIVQCFIYERGDQKLSTAAIALTSALWASMIVALALALFGAISFLDMLFEFSYAKLVVTATKYIPQAILNYRRKSTVG